MLRLAVFLNYFFFSNDRQSVSQDYKFGVGLLLFFFFSLSQNMFVCRIFPTARRPHHQKDKFIFFFFVVESLLEIPLILTWPLFYFLISLRVSVSLFFLLKQNRLSPNFIIIINFNFPWHFVCNLIHFILLLLFSCSSLILLASFYSNYPFLSLIFFFNCRVYYY